ALSIRRSSGPKRAGRFGRCVSAVLFLLRCSIFRAEREKWNTKEAQPDVFSLRGLVLTLPPGRRLTLPGCRGRRDRLQHAMARDRVVERGAELRPLAIVAGETRVRLGDVGGRALRRRPPVLLRHRQQLERG